MDFLRNIWLKIKSPKGLPLALFYMAFFIIIPTTLVLVIMVKEQSFWHYIMYVLSAVSLTYFIYTVVVFAPKVKVGIVAILNKFSFTRSLLESYGFRTIVFSIFSFVFNIAYVVFQVILALLNKSFWFWSIAIYYLILTLIKGGVLFTKKKNGDNLDKQISVFRASGILMVLLAVALLGILILLYTSNRSFEYAGLLIYAAAAYTFYKLSMSIYNYFKVKKIEDLYVKCIRNVNLCSALVSIFVLQVALIQAFSSESVTSMFNALTGMAIMILILLLGVLQLVRARKLKKDRVSGVISEEEFRSDKTEDIIDLG